MNALLNEHQNYLEAREATLCCLQTTAEVVRHLRTLQDQLLPALAAYNQQLLSSLQNVGVDQNKRKSCSLDVELLHRCLRQLEAAIALPKARDDNASLDDIKCLCSSAALMHVLFGRLRDDLTEVQGWVAAHQVHSNTPADGDFEIEATVAQLQQVHLDRVSQTLELMAAHSELASLPAPSLRGVPGSLAVKQAGLLSAEAVLDGLLVQLGREQKDVDAMKQLFQTKLHKLEKLAVQQAVRRTE
jgi:hypothetical protein